MRCGCAWLPLLLHPPRRDMHHALPCPPARSLVVQVRELLLRADVGPDASQAKEALDELFSLDTGKGVSEPHWAWGVCCWCGPDPRRLAIPGQLLTCQGAPNVLLQGT